MFFGQFISTTQFYLYGRQHCTRLGWENAIKCYPSPDVLGDQTLDLSDKVYIVTGANAGIGNEISRFLAAKNATVYMICRNPSRAYEARDFIQMQTKNNNVHVLLGDCGLEKDIRKVWNDFVDHRIKVDSSLKSMNDVKLDGLVCNAGALLNTKTLTSEGFEVTFATHLLFGTYLLGKLAMNSLQRTENSRVVIVSSGGMYNTKFPNWVDATSAGDKPYDGQMAYAYAKRGQVLLCERWAADYPTVKVVSCHPGWTETEGLDSAYGGMKWFLEPLRALWQGAEGIIWLCVADPKDIESGAFYLDRSPRIKNLVAPLLLSNRSFTENSQDEVDDMMARLAELCSEEKLCLTQQRETAETVVTET